MLPGLAAGAGVVAPLIMALAGQATWLAASLAAAAVGLAALFLGRRRAIAELGAQEPAPPPQIVESQTPYAAMLDVIIDAILLVQAGAREDAGNRRFIYANAAAREAFRIQRAEGPLATVIRAPAVLEAVEEALFDARPSETIHIVQGVQEVFWRARAIPVEPAPGQPPLALLVLRDETETHRNERTRVDFLANASHELRTPLASLSGFIETLRGHARDDPEARDKFLGIMQAQAERMRRLIDDLLSLSRIELAEHIRPTGRVDVGGVVTDVVDALSPLSKQREVAIEVILPPAGSAMMAADRDQIMQVVQNLIENAIKYTPSRGQVTLEVRVAVTPAQAGAGDDRTPRFAILTPDHPSEHGYVAIRVRDAGPGIARGHLSRLTERFYRVEGQKARERPGTGLGLAIVKHIVNRHRGGLVVESAEGAGALFIAYVPMAADVRTDAPTKAAEAAMT